MPLYEYISEQPNVKGKSCIVCSRGFELYRRIDQELLASCPTCRQPVKKLISAVSKPNVAKPFSYSDAKNAGFQVLKKCDEGKYEKM